MGNCPVCKNANATNRTDTTTHDHHIDCPRCGNFTISGDMDSTLSQDNWPERFRANISGWIYENQNPNRILRREDIERAANLKPPSFHDRADNLLRTIEKNTEKLGDLVEKKPHWISCAWCIDEGELNQIVHYLITSQMIHSSNNRYQVLPNGWARLDEIRKINPESEQGFVAMWFNEGVNHVYDDCIALAIADAGYKPHRVDKREHNDKIDDEIIAQIRQSRFVVADFTGDRGGVYFEAGFAKALGLEVFWTCRKNHMKKLHFDIDHFNFIFWEKEKLADFQKRLTDKIIAVLGKGNYKT